MLPSLIISLCSFLLTRSRRFSVMVVSIQVLPVSLQQSLQVSIDSNRGFLPLLLLVNSSTLRVPQRKQRTCRDNPSARSEAEGPAFLQLASVTWPLCWRCCLPVRRSSSACYTEASHSSAKLLASVPHSLTDRVCAASRFEFWSCCSHVFFADGHAPSTSAAVIWAPSYSHGVILTAKIHQEITLGYLQCQPFPNFPTG